MLQIALGPCGLHARCLQFLLQSPGVVPWLSAAQDEARQVMRGEKQMRHDATWICLASRHLSLDLVL